MNFTPEQMAEILTAAAGSRAAARAYAVEAKHGAADAEDWTARAFWIDVVVTLDAATIAA